MGPTNARLQRLGEEGMSDTKTIYVVLWSDGYEDSAVECAYTTEEAANEFIKGDELKPWGPGYYVAEVELKE